MDTGHVPGPGVRVPRRERRPLRGRRLHRLQGRWARQVRAEQRRVLVGDERAQDLLRLLGNQQPRSFSLSLAAFEFAIEKSLLINNLPPLHAPLMTKGKRIDRVPVPAGVPRRRPQMRR
jgi:hypothetical protein